MRGAVDPRSDVFSFGVVLYELLAGKHPFRRGTATATLTAIMEETPPNLESLGRGTSPAAGAIVRRCLEKGTEDHYESGHDLALVLDAVFGRSFGSGVASGGGGAEPVPGAVIVHREGRGGLLRLRATCRVSVRQPNRGLVRQARGGAGCGRGRRGPQERRTEAQVVEQMKSWLVLMSGCCSKKRARAGLLGTGGGCPGGDGENYAARRRRATRPSRPLPTRSNVAGSGTGSATKWKSSKLSPAIQVPLPVSGV